MGKLVLVQQEINTRILNTALRHDGGLFRPQLGEGA